MDDVGVTWWLASLSSPLLHFSNGKRQFKWQIISDLAWLVQVTQFGVWLALQWKERKKRTRHICCDILLAPGVRNFPSSFGSRLSLTVFVVVVSVDPDYSVYALLFYRGRERERKEKTLYSIVCLLCCSISVDHHHHQGRLWLRSRTDLWSGSGFSSGLVCRWKPMGWTVAAGQQQFRIGRARTLGARPDSRQRARTSCRDPRTSSRCHVDRSPSRTLLDFLCSATARNRWTRSRQGRSPVVRQRMSSFGTHWRRYSPAGQRARKTSQPAI